MSLIQRCRRRLTGRPTAPLRKCQHTFSSKASDFHAVPTSSPGVRQPVRPGRLFQRSRLVRLDAVWCEHADRPRPRLRGEQRLEVDGGGIGDALLPDDIKPPPNRRQPSRRCMKRSPRPTRRTSRPGPRGEAKAAVRLRTRASRGHRAKAKPILERVHTAFAALQDAIWAIYAPAQKHGSRAPSPSAVPWPAASPTHRCSRFAPFARPSRMPSKPTSS